MAFFSGIKRRLSSLLGTDAGRPAAVAPSPATAAAPKAATDTVLIPDEDLVFDPSQPADAPFVDLHAIDLHALDQHALDQHALDQDALDQHALDRHAATPADAVEPGPVDGSKDIEPYPNDRRQKQRRNGRTGTRVLLVDDSPTIVALLRKLLRQNGYDTLEAGDAETGIELARSEQPDLIFLDIVLPGMNGFAALRALRRDPLTKIIPIIMISGNVAATEQFYVQRIGADDFMKKPFSRAEVFSRVEVLLDAAGTPRRSAERDCAPDMPALQDSAER